MKKILIISDDFPPNWAPRIGYLVKYLKENGYLAYVIAGVNNTRRVYGFLTGYAERVEFFEKKGWGRYDPRNILECFLPIRPGRGEIEMRKRAMQWMQEESFCLVLTSTCGLLPSYTAYCLAAEKKLPFVADFRDIKEQDPNRSTFTSNIKYWPFQLRTYVTTGFHKHYRSRVLKGATALTTVSPYHQDILAQYNNKCHLIYNGFDPEVFFPKAPEPTNVFRIIYTGTLSNPDLRDPSFLLKAVRRLHDKKQISPEYFRCVFYCGDPGENDILGSARRQGIDHYFEYREFVPADQVPELLHDASLLLLLTNRETEGGPKGIMTTKFFEYLAVNRPILSVRSDEAKVESIIKRTNAGIAARTADEAYQFILQQYQVWQEYGYTTGQSDMAEIQQFSRRLQAKQFAQIFDDITGRTPA